MFSWSRNFSDFNQQCAQSATRVDVFFSHNAAVLSIWLSADRPIELGLGAVRRDHISDVWFCLRHLLRPDTNLHGFKDLPCYHCLKNRWNSPNWRIWSFTCSWKWKLGFEVFTFSLFLFRKVGVAMNIQQISLQEWSPLSEKFNLKSSIPHGEIKCSQNLLEPHPFYSRL